MYIYVYICLWGGLATIALRCKKHIRSVKFTSIKPTTEQLQTSKASTVGISAPKNKHDITAHRIKTHALDNFTN